MASNEIGFTKQVKKNGASSDQGVRAKAGHQDASFSKVIVLLEEMREQNKATIEAVWAAKNELRDEFGVRFERIEMRLDVLESVVRQNSADIKKNSEDIRKNSEDIIALGEELRRLAQVVSTKAEAEVVESLRLRIERIEV